MSAYTNLESPVNPDDDGIGPAILGVSWTFTSLAILAVAMRFYVRVKVVHALSFDDWIMLLALAFQIVYQAIMTILCSYGLGKTPQNISLMELINTRKWMWISSPIANSVSIFARISISILLIRIFGTRQWFKWFFIVSCSLMVLLGILSPIFLFTQTKPVEALWDARIVGKLRFSPDIQYGVSFALQILFMISDITFALFPVLIIWKLNMALHRKVGLVLLMCLSLITFGAALLKFVLIIIQLTTPADVGHGNMSYFNGVYNLSTGIEQPLVIIMGCIPPLRPIAQLDFSISTIGSSLASFLHVPTIRSRKGSSSSESTGGRNHHEKSKYNDLELTPKYRPSDSGDEFLSGPRVTTMHAEGGSSHSLDLGQHVRRVDDFTVTYESGGRRVKEIV